MTKQNTRKNTPAIEDLMRWGNLSGDAYYAVEREGVIVEAEHVDGLDDGSWLTYLIFEGSDRCLTVRFETFFDEEEGAETSVDDILALAYKELEEALLSLGSIPELGE